MRTRRILAAIVLGLIGIAPNTYFDMDGHHTTTPVAEAFTPPYTAPAA